MNNEKVENYAKLLVKHGFYSTIDEARSESVRWHKKADQGFIEPLKCPHHPDIETKFTYKETGAILIEYKLVEK